MFRKLFLICFVLSLGLAGYARADIAIVQSVTSAGASYVPPANTINGSGMTGDLHDSLYGTLWMTAVGSNGGGFTNPHPGTYNPGAGDWTWIKFDFDRVYPLGELWVWNYNEWTIRGLRDVVIEYTSDGVTWNKLGDYQIARAPSNGDGHGYDNYAHNTTINFTGVDANSVIITTKPGVGVGNWGDSIPVFGLSEVRFYSLSPATATNPVPSDGTTNIFTGAKLKWSVEGAATSHDIYFGTNFDEVNTANTSSAAFKKNQPETTYYPGPMEKNTTYYWRIDERNGSHLWPGTVWSFTTVDADLPMELKRGVSMGKEPETLNPEDIQFVKSMGFDHVKLLIYPIPLKNGDGLYDANMWRFDSLVNTVVDGGLKAVVCIHAPEFLRIKVMRDWQEFEDMLGFYEALGKHMADRWSPSQVSFQLMTEPHSNAWDWNMMLTMMWEATRRGMPNHTLILPPTNSSLIEGGLVEVVPVDDKNVIYCFGFYEPYFFSLQGWPFDSTYQVSGVPYPSSPEIIAGVMDDILSSVPAQSQAQARNDLIAYGNERWNREKRAARLKMATDWAKNNGNQKLYVHEWALFMANVKPEDGYRFVRDGRELLEENGVGWSWFGYNEIPLTIFNGNRTPDGTHGVPPSPEWIDKELMSALGMYAGEGDVNRNGVIDFDDIAEIAYDWLENRLQP